MKLPQVIEATHLGLTMNVFRCALTGGCTRGASVRHNEIWVANDVGVFTERTRPLFRDKGYLTFAEAVARNIPCFQAGEAGDRRHIRPILKPDQTEGWFMMGGNFAYTSDSRGSLLPIPIHDRTEKDGRCYAFYGVGDGEVETDGYSSGGEFVQWLDNTLIPDLVVSGHEATADSFRTATKFIRSKLP